MLSCNAISWIPPKLGESTLRLADLQAVGPAADRFKQRYDLECLRASLCSDQAQPNIEDLHKLLRAFVENVDEVDQLSWVGFHVE